MDPIQAVGLQLIGAAGAAMLTGYLIAFFKKGVPEVRPLGLMLMQLVAGQLCAFLVTAIGIDGLALSLKGVATIVITGIVASATAAGLTKADQSAETDRRNAT